MCVCVCIMHVCMNVYQYTYMHVTTINEKEAMNWKENKEGYKGRT